ncbi:hypothetical protein QTG56_03190 [Rossellomorea sp. AcN35-11]|nr:hypothetical protein [Rossellomorea aquimaris]WJV30166.1 hypothetical protein QTG56_03190 [Rossellomorea sp. AcN35-11]
MEFIRIHSPPPSKGRSPLKERRRMSMFRLYSLPLPLDRDPVDTTRNHLFNRRAIVTIYSLLTGWLCYDYGCCQNEDVEKDIRMERVSILTWAGIKAPCLLPCSLAWRQGSEQLHSLTFGVILLFLIIQSVGMYPLSTFLLKVK